MHRLLPALAAVVLLLLCVSSTIVRAQEVSPSTLDSLAGHGKVMFGKKDGSIVMGEVTEVTADSLILGDGKKRKAVPRADIEQVWGRDKMLAEAALGGAAIGALGGAFLEYGLGTCDECGSRTGDVLESAAIGAAGRAVEGVLIELLGPHWRPVKPSPNVLHRGRMSAWHPFAASLRTGSAGHLDSEFGDLLEDVAGGFTGWANSVPGGSWGFEYGMLDRAQTDRDGNAIVPGDTLLGRPADTLSYSDHWTDRWAFSGINIRARSPGVGSGGFVILGTGVYLKRRAGSSVWSSASGLYNQNSTFKRTDGWFGVNGGGGATFGHGDWRPAIEGRIHWAFSSERLWLTLQAGVDFQ